MNELQAFEFSRQLICDIYWGMWTYAVMCHADCIRLLVGWQRHERLSLGMILEHSSAAPYSVQQHKELLQSCYWKLEVNPTYGADLAHQTISLCQWHNTWEVTNCTARRMQESIFCYDNFKYLAKMKRACQGAVGLCQKIMTPQWNYCASFFVVVTFIQIMSVTEGAALLEQSSLSFQCHICCFISRSEVKFSCGKIVVEFWNSGYVVLIVKYVFILKMVCFPCFLRCNI